MGWPGAARDRDTFCVSCHTVLPYILSRPALRPALAEPGQSDDERKILGNVTKGVHLWNEIEPYYSDREYDEAKPVESRGTEAVLNALILSANDARTGKLSDVTRIPNMWASQTTEVTAEDLGHGCGSAWNRGKRTVSVLWRYSGGSRCGYRSKAIPFVAGYSSPAQFIARLSEHQIRNPIRPESCRTSVGVNKNP